MPVTERAAIVLERLAMKLRCCGQLLLGRGRPMDQCFQLSAQPTHQVRPSPGDDVSHDTGAVYDAEVPSAAASNPPGEWNHFKISFVGSRIEVELNGVKIVDWEAEPRGKIEDFATQGYIGLQNHDDRSPVYFRNIYVKAL